MPDIVRLGSCPSTMDEARSRAREGAPDGTVVVAEQQTGARGRLERSWHSPQGGLYISIVLRDLKDPHLLTLALGCAVAETLEVVGVEPRLKWVNDVLVDDRKVAGILVESEATGDRIDFLVAGIGINVNGHADDMPPDVQERATTIEDALGVEQCLPDLETFLLETLEPWIARVREGRDEEIVAAWRERDALLGARVHADGGDGPVVGVAKGIDDRGRLLVATDDGMAVVQSGTVRTQ